MKHLLLFAFGFTTSSFSVAAERDIYTPKLTDGAIVWERSVPEKQASARLEVDEAKPSPCNSAPSWKNSGPGVALYWCASTLDIDAQIADLDPDDSRYEMKLQMLENYRLCDQPSCEKPSKHSR